MSTRSHGSTLAAFLSLLCPAAACDSSESPTAKSASPTEEGEGDQEEEEMADTSLGYGGGWFDSPSVPSLEEACGDYMTTPDVSSVDRELLPCALPDPLPENGVVHCEDGHTFRAFPGIDELGARYGSPEACHQTLESEDECQFPTDCTEGPFPICHEYQFNGPGPCECEYQCRCDADCPEGQGCVDGMCLDGSCRTNDDCGGRSCGVGIGLAEAKELHCQTPEDECQLDADCDQEFDCEACSRRSDTDRWTCRWVCGD